MRRADLAPVQPGIVVLPRTAEQVAAIVGECAARSIPFVARGSGTGLSGGALPRTDGVLIVTSKMRSIIAIDPASRRAIVEPGVTNLAVSKAAEAFGLFYAPDPSSQVVCSVGGNVAENSGGAHCLKHGFTVHHVTGLQIVTPAGELTWLGDGTGVAAGYDLVGAFTGSEGTLGIVTKVIVKLTPIPEAVTTLLAAFTTMGAGGAAVSAIIAAGILPAAIEMMDALAIEAAEAAVHCRYPDGAGAVLIVELDGPAADVETQTEAVRRLCTAADAYEIRAAQDATERAAIWRGRKSAFAAVGRISPAYIVQDGVVPRTALPAVLDRISQLSAETGIRVANVFHAGDGNLHPLVLFDDTVPGEQESAEKLSGMILDLCIEHGGSITGEHGVGVDKSRYMPRMFGADDLDTMQLLRCAFDPAGLCNPGKVFPTPRLCGEVPGVRRGPHPLVAAWPDRSILMGTGPSGTSAAQSIAAQLANTCADLAPATELDVVGGRQARYVAAPGSAAETAALLATAAELDLTVVPRGSGSRLDWGTAPASCDLIVDTRRLDQVIEHAAGDLVVTVQAGVRLDDLAAMLGHADQRLALDPPPAGGPDARVGTVGGLIATGVAGPLRFRYGSPRDLLIGITVIRADGKITKSGGKVVKNVAGYDLGKLFTGSYGTLGLITEATFRLHPAPTATAVITVECASGGAAAETVAVMTDSPLAPSAIDLDWPSAVAPISVSVLLEGDATSVDGRAERMVALLGTRATVGQPSDRRKRSDGRSTHPPRTTTSGTKIRITFWAGQLPQVLGVIREAAAEHGLDPAIGGSAGAGVLEVDVAASASPASVCGFVERVRAGLGGVGAVAGGPPSVASAVVLNAPAEVRDAVDLWGPVPSLGLMRAVKDRFDPEHRMAPGRFAGGI